PQAGPQPRLLAEGRDHHGRADRSHGRWLGARGAHPRAGGGRRRGLRAGPGRPRVRAGGRRPARRRAERAADAAFRQPRHQERLASAMRIALDPYMLRTTPLAELPGVVAEFGYEHIELSPREDFIPFFVPPRADRATIAGFKKALNGAGVSVSSVLPLYKWSGPDEDEGA